MLHVVSNELAALLLVPAGDNAVIVGFGAADLSNKIPALKRQ